MDNVPERVKGLAARDAFATLLGAECVEARTGSAVVHITGRDQP